MTIGIAILGVGRWGTHLTRNFSQHSEAQVVAVVDHHPERLAACQAQFGFDESVVLSTTWDEVRQLQAIDAVAIATPASTHYPLIVDALELGYHVLAEKPLTLDAIECLQLAQLARDKQLQLLVDHTYLFHPAVERGREAIAAEKLGTLRYGYATRTHLGPVRHDVDALWDLAIHDICILNSWLGQTPIQVEARGTVWLQSSHAIAGRPPATPQDLSDLVWATLTYPDGFRASIHLCWLNPDKQRRLCVAGERGTLIFDEMQPKQPLTLQRGYFEEREGQFVPAGVEREVLEVQKAEPLGRVCDRFLRNIRTDATSSPSSGWVGAELVQILSCLSASLHQGGRPVPVPPLTEFRIEGMGSRE